MRPQFLAPPLLSAAILALKPSNFWPVDEMSGTLVRDMVGGFNGTANAGVKRGTRGPPGLITSSAASASFPGGANSVNCGSVPTNQTAYTLLAFIFPGALGDQGILGRWNASAGMNLIGNYNGTPQKLVVLHAGIANWLIANTTPELNRWHCVAATWDGATIRVYLDGREDGNKAVVTAPGTSANHFQVGAYNGTAGLGFVGNLAGAAYWGGTALSPTAIANLSKLGLGQ